MYRAQPRPRPRLLGQAPRPERSPWPLVISAGVILTLVVAGLSYMGSRTAQMQARSRRMRRWG